jgi:hypothetical protein
VEVLTLETVVSKLRKVLKDNYQSVGDSMIAGGAKDYSQYKYMLGQAQAYQAVDQALTDILKPTEEENEDERQADNVIDFERSSED